MSNRYPPLLLKYLKIFQEDPTSKVFAPLAEAYRKIGLLEEAVQICIEGLSANPEFLGGKVALARAYFDQHSYQKVRETLEPHIQQIPDNLVAQRLYGDACLYLGYPELALNAYKLLLYFNPNDAEVLGIVQELETRQYEQGGLIGSKIRPEKLRQLIRLQRALISVQRSL